MTTYFYAYIEAEDEEQAWDKAMSMDGGDFIPFNQGIVAEGDWDILETQLQGA
jgi:hypothetical protein